MRLGLVTGARFRGISPVSVAPGLGVSAIGFIRSQFDVFASQAGEIRALTTKIAADTSEPIKEQVSRSFEGMRKS